MQTTLDLIKARKLKPVSGKLLVRIDRIQTFGSLILPESAQTETSTGTIVAFGPDLPDYVIEGRKLLPHSQAGLEVYGDSSVRYVMYSLEDIQLLFEDAEAEAKWQKGQKK